MVRKWEKWKEEKYNDLGALIRIKEWNEEGELVKDEEPEKVQEDIRSQKFKTTSWVAKDGIEFFKLKGENDSQEKTDHEQLIVHYATYLESGKELDNSFRKKRPLTIRLNRKSMIEGFLKGVRYFEKGDNGYIKIPYQLAYGAKGGQNVPAYATVYFHVIIVEAE